MKTREKKKLETTKFEKREYQEKVIEFVKKSYEQKKNVIIELDCGLGKRIITLKLLENLFAEKKILVILHSSSSLAETVKFFQDHFHRDFGWLSSRTNKYFRKKTIAEKKVVFSTPQIIRNLINQGVSLDSFDVLIINEVDKIVRRIGEARRVLIQPWPPILDAFRNKIIIGMSGTLRDTHIIQGKTRSYVTSELFTLVDVIRNTNILTMDDVIKGTDIKEYIKKTIIIPVPVYDEVIVNIIKKIDERVKQIFSELRNDGLFKQDVRDARGEFILPKDQDDPRYIEFMKLTLLRKYLVAMTPKKVRKMWMAYEKALIQDLNKIPSSDRAPKIDELFKILNEKRGKIVVLCSYKDMVREIYKRAVKFGFIAYTLTGETFDKKKVIIDFENEKNRSLLIISPVGERDLDFSTVENMVVVDVINTTKTMYQRIKRIRGGTVYILYYRDTSEEKKVQNLLNRIKTRYPWSIEIRSYHLT